MIKHMRVTFHNIKKTYHFHYYNPNDVPERYVHLSKCENIKTLEPKVPSFLEYVNDKLVENNIDPRVCFSTRVQLALNSIPNVKIGDVYYVYVPVDTFPDLPGKRDVAQEMRENNKGPVYDAERANECWATKPVNVYLWKTIRVTVIDEISSIKFYDVIKDFYQ